MRKSAKVTLTIVAALGMAGCNRHRQDPCDAGTFSEESCQEAVRRGGYYWRGAWVPMVYSNPYPYYYDAYRRRVDGGGVVHVAPPGSYAHPSVTRGGFGSVGAGRGIGG
jgi:hypothetical protein